MRIGEVLDGKYLLDQLLGESGMGLVFKGRHHATSKDVTVKLVHPHIAAHGESVERFLSEARAISVLETPHIPPVIDAGRANHAAPYYVRDYLEGRDLAQARRDAGGRLSPAEAIPLIQQACAGLVEAHAQGIFHFNLKPENLFLAQDGKGGEEIKLLDFGVAGLRDSLARDSDDATVSGAMIGLPHYMPIEQARGTGTRDHRVDIYALGVVLYELLAGERPLESDNYTRLLLLIATSEPSSLIEKRPALGEDLTQVIHRALSRELDDRYQSVQELSDALTPFRELELDDPPPSKPKPKSSRSNFSTTQREIPIPQIPAPTLSTSETKPKTAGSQNRIWLLVGAIALFAIVGGITTVVFVYAGREPPAVLAQTDVDFQDSEGGQGWSDRCFYHFSAERLSNARAACIKGLEIARTDDIKASIYYNLGRIAAKQQKHSRARDYYEKSLELRPGNIAVQDRLRELPQ